MLFKAAGYSTKGAVKPSNQDSFLIKVARTPFGDVALVVVADGMGGLSKGELASAQVVRAMDCWFEEKLPGYLEAMGSSVSGLERLVEAQWNGLVQELNISILQYGKRNHINLGTTFTAMLCVGNRYSVAHVGDSRAYRITEGKAAQLTEDQTLVQRELSAGRITEEEALVHPHRNVLLQCIGASREVVPQVISGNLDKGATYLLCSDGFRHEISEGELAERFAPKAIAGLWDSGSEEPVRYEEVESCIRECVEQVEARGEKDNITAVVLSLADGEGR